MDNISENQHQFSPSSPNHAVSSNFRVLRQIWACNRGLTLVSALTTLTQGIFPAATAWVSKLVIDRVVMAIGHPALGASLVLPAILLGLGLGLVSTLLQHVGQLAWGLLQDLFGNRIDEMIIEKALTLDLSFYENPRFYDMLRRAQSGAGARSLALLTQLLAIASSSITTISLLILLLRFDAVVALVLMLTVFPALFVHARYGREAYDLFSYRAPESRKLAYYSQLLTSDQWAKELKLYNLGQLLLKRYRSLFAEFYRQNQALAVRHQASMVWLALLSAIGYYGCYSYAIYQVIMGAVTLGDLMLYTLAFQQLQTALRTLLSGLATTYENSLFVSNLSTFMELQPLIPTSPAGCRPVESWQGEIVFHNVSFRYANTGKYTLRNVNLRLRPQERVALVGKNGAGKTTLIKLLCRLYDPTDGYITLDGVDIREYDQSSLQRHIGVIFQDFVRYYLTARENIGFSQAERMADQVSIEAAAKKSGAHEIINTLPNGYSTMLGCWFDDGQQLSLGEWQRIALARAFMRDADLLILDEPTASLDVDSENTIFRRFAELARNRTAILISHRFSTVRMADRIVVLDDGQIVEDGAHQQLLDAGGIYADWFTKQVQGYR